MSTVATILPMSLLACLGSDAEAIRDILIHRLEAQTEDILLKIAIIKFFKYVLSTSCSDNNKTLVITKFKGTFFGPVKKQFLCWKFDFQNFYFSVLALIVSRA